jgi:hypothetical protein
MFRYPLFICLIILTLTACTSSIQTQNPAPTETASVTNPESTSLLTSEPLLPEAYMMMGTNWLWQGYSEIGSPELNEIEDYQNYNLVMYVDGQAYVQADCKDVYGSYTPARTKLTISLDAIPEIACSEGSLSDLFIDYISKVTKFEFRDDNLILWVGDEAKMFFVNGGPAGD